MAVGAIACETLADELSADGISTPAICFEWLVIESLVRRLSPQEIPPGIPGSQKARAVVNRKQRLSAATYLKGPSVFGFNGVYKPFAVDAHVVSSDLEPGSRCAELTRGWESEQGFAGFTDAVPGTDGGRLGPSCVTRCETPCGRDDAPRTRGAGCSAGWRRRCTLTRRGPGSAGCCAPWSPPASTTRAELAAHLAGMEGALSEAELLDAVRPSCSPALGSIIDAVVAYERFAALVDVAFRTLCAVSHSMGAQPLTPALVDQHEMIVRCARELPDRYCRAAEQMAAIGAESSLEERLGEFAIPRSPNELVELLLEHHERIQAGKPPQGKRPWFEPHRNGWVVRGPYGTAGSPSSELGSCTPSGSPRSAASSRTPPRERRPAARSLVAARRRRGAGRVPGHDLHLRVRLLRPGLPRALLEPVDRRRRGRRHLLDRGRPRGGGPAQREAQVSVLVDRSSPAEKRNLRWDLLPVGVPGGLLHAKVAALLWERSARIILGSANLTSAGYRRQVELALAFDLDDGCRMPGPVIDELVAELRHLVELAPGPASGPKGRALAIVELLAARVEALGLPRTGDADLRLAVAPARPGTSPLDRLGDVWRGGQPLGATVLSPFWDDAVPAPAVEAVRGRLTGRPASRRWNDLVAAVDPFTGMVQAPASLAAQAGSRVTAFDPPDPEQLRSLHAKLVIVESDDWLAALIGSSNATEAGLGLDPRRGHHELNLWLGCPAGSKTAKHLRALARGGEQIDLDDQRWEPLPDEDEPTTPLLPAGFVRCTIDAATPPRLLLELDPRSLPASWLVRSPAGRKLLTADSWRATGSPRSAAVDLPDEALPSYLLVCWDANGEQCNATWTVNVEDRGALPPPAELADLPVDVLLAALASTRPLPVALEHELRRRQRAGDDGRRIELDPLRRFDDSGLLLQRTRHLSLALWRLQERLSRPQRASTPSTGACTEHSGRSRSLTGSCRPHSDERHFLAKRTSCSPS